MINCEGCPIDAIHETEEERLKCVCRERCERAYQQGRADAYTKMENEINYLINCGMGKKKGLEHLLKICKEEQK